MTCPCGCLAVAAEVIARSAPLSVPELLRILHPEWVPEEIARQAAWIFEEMAS
jgi:hypothetical protein